VCTCNGLEDKFTGTTDSVCLMCGFFLRWRIEEVRVDREKIISRFVSKAKGR
jgi:hypothetical protein